MREYLPLANSSVISHGRRLVLNDNSGVVSNLAVVIVTWRDYVYTAACVHSLLASNLKPKLIVVVDNGTNDITSQRLEEILTCTRADSTCPCANEELNNFCLLAEEFNFIYPNDFLNHNGLIRSPNTLVTLITAAENEGFARGNNLGIEFLSNIGHEGCIWMLNNDAYVATDCIDKIVSHGQKSRLPELFGTALVEYHNPKIIQALGGTLVEPWLSSRPNFAGKELSSILTKDKVVQADFPIGASMLSWSDRLYEKRHPMYEGYFLYYEEVELCMDLGISYCPIYVDALVGHIGGATTGDDKFQNTKKRSLTRDYYGTRSRVIYCSRHKNRNITYVIVFCIGLVLKRFISMKFTLSIAVARGLIDGLKLVRSSI